MANLLINQIEYPTTSLFYVVANELARKHNKSITLKHLVLMCHASSLNDVIFKTEILNDIKHVLPSSAIMDDNVIWNLHVSITSCQKNNISDDKILRTVFERSSLFGQIV